MTIRVNFSGLITFVPNTNRKAMRIVFVDGFEPHFGLKRRVKDLDNELLFPHIPVVSFRLGDLDEKSSRQPDLTAGGYGACFLSYEEFWLGKEARKDSLSYRNSDLPLQDEAPVNASTAGAPMAGDHYSCQPGSRYLPRRSEKQASTARSGSKLSSSLKPDDLCWLLPLGKVLKQDKGLAVRKDVLKYKLKPGGRVIARTRLNSGRLYTRAFANSRISGERRVLYWDFKFEDQDDPHYTQVLSTVVTYEPRDQTKLKIVSKSGDWEIPDLLFTPKKGFDLEVNFWNAPLSDLLNLLGGEGSHQFPKASGFSSFRSYFRLLRGIPKDRELPSMLPRKTVVARYQAYETDGGKDVGCPSALAPADKDA